MMSPDCHATGLRVYSRCMASAPGSLAIDVIEARFPFSGTVSTVSVVPGQRVTKGSRLAELERTILQTELDRDLASYEKVRAGFELFLRKLGESTDDTSKYERTERQSTLDIAVKNVELSKYKLDQATLPSPVDGIIADTGGLVPGAYVTPSGNPVRILPVGSVRFVFTVTGDTVREFLSPRSVSVRIPVTGQEYRGTSGVPIAASDGKFVISIPLQASELITGMTGEAEW